MAVKQSYHSTHAADFKSFLKKFPWKKSHRWQRFGRIAKRPCYETGQTPAFGSLLASIAEVKQAGEPLLPRIGGLPDQFRQVKAGNQRKRKATNALFPVFRLE
jgi:hypothetical protein